MILTYTEEKQTRSHPGGTEASQRGQTVALRCEKEEQTEMRYLTIALTKGRLANKTLDMLERSGSPVRR